MTGIRIAIKQFNDSNYSSYKNEKAILSNIRAIGNFPEFFDSIERNNKFYIFESQMGPSFDFLEDLFNGHFNLFTTLNIGIDAIRTFEYFIILAFFIEILSQII